MSRASFGNKRPLTVAVWGIVILIGLYVVVCFCLTFGMMAADAVVPVWSHSDVLQKALLRHNVPYRYLRVNSVGHGCGIADGTAAEGWLKQGVEFWQQQSA